MRAILMVVANILREQSLEMAVIHRDNVVQQVSSAAFDPKAPPHHFARDSRRTCGQDLSSGIDRPPEPPTRISHPGGKSQTRTLTRMEPPPVPVDRSTGSSGGLWH